MAPAWRETTRQVCPFGSQLEYGVDRLVQRCGNAELTAELHHLSGKPVEFYGRLPPSRSWHIEALKVGGDASPNFNLSSAKFWVAERL